MSSAVAEFFRYNRWAANLRLVDACADLTDEQLAARVTGASGSIRELVMHVVGGQQTFIQRLKGRQHEGELGRGSAWPGIHGFPKRFFLVHALEHGVAHRTEISVALAELGQSARTSTGGSTAKPRATAERWLTTGVTQASAESLSDREEPD